MDAFLPDSPALSQRGRIYIAELAWRLLLRDLASGRLFIMLLASLIAVASTVSVNLLVTRVEQVLVGESSALLAADIAIVTNDPPPPRYERDARARGLDTARIASMRSVVSHEEQLELVRLKAVDSNYPLRGWFDVADKPFEASTRVDSGPERGEAWAAAKLFQLLVAEIGDTCR